MANHGRCASQDVALRNPLLDVNVGGNRSQRAFLHATPGGEQRADRQARDGLQRRAIDPAERRRSTDDGAKRDVDERPLFTRRRPGGRRWRDPSSTMRTRIGGWAHFPATHRPATPGRR